MTEDPEAQLRTALAALTRRVERMTRCPPPRHHIAAAKAVLQAASGLLDDLLQADDAGDFAATRHPPHWWAKQARLPLARLARTAQQRAETAEKDAAIFDALEALGRALYPKRDSERAGIVARHFGCSAQHVRRVRRRVLDALAKKGEPA